MTAVTSLLLALVPSLTVLAEPSLPAAVIALALAALCAGRPSRLVVAVPARAVGGHTSYGDRPAGRGRATDPVHHPLRPRAPGVA